MCSLIKEASMNHPWTKLAPLPSMRFGEGENEIVFLARDLPLPGTFRWNTKKQRLFVKAVRHGLLTLDQFLKNYEITVEEFAAWGGEVPQERLAEVAKLTLDPVYVRVGNLTIDLNTKVVTIGERHIILKKREYKILECLARKQGKIVSKAELIEFVYGAGSLRDPKGVDVHLTKLRKKLGGAAAYVETKWGRGHILKNHMNTGETLGEA